MIREWEGVDCATVNLSVDSFERVMYAMLDVGSASTLACGHRSRWSVLRCGLMTRVQRVSIELDPGEPYFLQGEPLHLAQQVNDLLDDVGSTCTRLTHGMNDWTWALVEDAFRRGHDTRVGFEDSVLLPNGTKADDNAQLVEAAVVLQYRLAS
jgi:hypothetical protein